MRYLVSDTYDEEKVLWCYVEWHRLIYVGQPGKSWIRRWHWLKYYCKVAASAKLYNNLCECNKNAEKKKMHINLKIHRGWGARYLLRMD